MGFINIEIIIEVPMVLNEFPKYWDEIKNRLPPKNEIFSVSGYSIYCCGAWDLKNSIFTRPSQKKIFSILATVLLCMVCVTFKNFNGYLTLTEKKKILLFLVILRLLWSISLWKYQSPTDPQWILFQFFSTTAQWYMGIEKASDKK